MPIYNTEPSRAIARDSEYIKLTMTTAADKLQTVLLDFMINHEDFFHREGDREGLFLPEQMGSTPQFLPLPPQQ